MASATIVVIEDEEDIREIITHNLTREGYAVHASGDGEDGLRLVRRLIPDLVILDLMLPGMDGTEVCRSLKNDSATAGVPVIMVTAKSEESDVVLGLGLGADDYIGKPFSPREFVARCRAVLRRSRKAASATAEDQRMVCGPVVIDAGRHEVSVDGQGIVFTATEFRLLHFLATHAGRVFTRDQLIGRIIGDGAIVIDRNIDVHVRSVRKKLGPHRDMIETVRGVGYRFSDLHE